jgi:protein-disulfide isomerase
MSELRFPVSDQDHSIGPSGAPVTLVEYGDYQCPHCQAAWPQVEQVLQHLGRNLRYVYRHFPIWTTHPLAKPAAETAEFAGARQRFWEMHSALFANAHRLSRAVLLSLAAREGLDPNELSAALDQHDYAPKVDADFLSGVRSGVNGTPLMKKHGVRHNGTYDAISLSTAIERAGSGRVAYPMRMPVP